MKFQVRRQVPQVRGSWLKVRAVLRRLTRFICSLGGPRDLSGPAGLLPPLGGDARRSAGDGIWAYATSRRRGAAGAAADQEVPVPDNTTETPVLDTLTAMIGASVDHNTLSPRSSCSAGWRDDRDGGAACLLPLQCRGRLGAGDTADDIQGVMIGVAPVVGAPRVVAAGETSCGLSASLSR